LPVSMSLLVLLCACAGSPLSPPVSQTPASSNSPSPQPWKFYYKVTGDTIALEANGIERKEAPEDNRDLYLIPWTGLLLRSASPTLADGVVLYFPKQLRAEV
jgi:hypothetical protein